VTTHDEAGLARLIRALPPAPEAWVAAASELPPARRELDDIVARAEADAAFREALLADLESALVAAGYEPDAALVTALRIRLSA
jgi:hypothetical protein